MKPFRRLDSVVTRDGVELTLHQRGEAFYIQIDGYDLMSSRAHGSEDELARLALSEVRTGNGARPDGAGPRVLVGGLGMGFTLRATLNALGGRTSPGKAAEVVVAEVFPAVVDWNRGPLANLAGRPLADPRVRVVEGDVGELLAEAGDESGDGGAFDAILLDVDNGPEAITLEANSRLYTDRGLARTYRALAPGGVLAVWSAHDEPRFVKRLRKAGFRVATHRVSERHGGKGGRHTIFVATRPRGGPRGG